MKKNKKKEKKYSKNLDINKKNCIFAMLIKTKRNLQIKRLLPIYYIYKTF